MRRLSDLFAVLFFFIFSQIIHSQTLISGHIFTEENIALGSVVVINMKSEKRVVNGGDGSFTIDANLGDEIRFVKNGYDRKSHVVSREDFNSNFEVVLKRLVQTIDEVEIEYKVSGNLAKDSKHYNEKKEITEVKIELGQYIMKKSDPSVTALKGGDFKQPKGPGFVVGDIKDKWTKIDLIENLIEVNTIEFFTEGLQLHRSQVSGFISYILRFYEHRSILKYGIISTKDLARFIDIVNRKEKDYKESMAKSE